MNISDVSGAPPLPPAATTKSDNRARGREKKERIEFVGKMLSMGWSTKEVEAVAGSRYGVSGRAVRTYIKLARRSFVKSMDMTSSEMNAYLFHLLLDVVKHPATNGNAKVKAVSEMAKLTGAYAPTKSIVANIDGHSMSDLLDLVEGERRAPIVGDLEVRKAVAKAIGNAQPEPSMVIEEKPIAHISEQDDLEPVPVVAANEPAAPVEQVEPSEPLDPFEAAIAEASENS